MWSVRGERRSSLAPGAVPPNECTDLLAYKLAERRTPMRFPPRTINLVTRVLFAILIAGLLPFVGVALVGLNGYRVASTNAESTTAKALDDASSGALLQRTQQTAVALGAFLDERADDTRTTALLPPDPVLISRFAARTQ